jgi:hypothetical protein
VGGCGCGKGEVEVTVRGSQTSDLCRGNFLGGVFSNFSCSLTPGPGHNTLFYL